MLQIFLQLLTFYLQIIFYGVELNSRLVLLSSYFQVFSFPRNGFRPC